MIYLEFFVFYVITYILLDTIQKKENDLLVIGALTIISLISFKLFSGLFALILLGVMGITYLGYPQDIVTASHFRRRYGILVSFICFAIIVCCANKFIVNLF